MKKLETDAVKPEEKRSWWVLEFDVESRSEDMASWLMIQLGANGCQFISSKDGVVTMQASFEADRIDPNKLQPVHAALDEYGLAPVAATLRINKLEEEDWLAEWKKGMEPIKLGEKFLVSPPWFKDKIAEVDLQGRQIIWIEPGLAFGTGFHATTQFCLQAVESYLGSIDKSQKWQILDVGTGSGILAIAAAHLLPNAEILALEIDPTACRVAAENFALNDKKQIKLIEGSTEKVLGRKFDAILSNLTCEDNVALLQEYVDALPPGGKLILSGILLEKSAIIEKAIAGQALKIVHKEEREIWAGLVVERI